MSRTTICMTCVLVIAGHTMANEPEFLFSRDLKLPVMEQDELVAVELDEVVYA